MRALLVLLLLGVGCEGCVLGAKETKKPEVVLAPPAPEPTPPPTAQPGLATAFSPDSSVAFRFRNGTFSLFRLVSGQDAKEEPITLQGLPVEGLQVAAMSDALLFLGYSSGEVFWVDLNEKVSKGKIKIAPNPYSVESLAVSKDGAWAFAGHPSGAVTPIQTKTASQLDSRELKHGKIAAMDVSAQGNAVLIAGEDGTVTLWDISKSAPVTTMTGHSRGVWDVLFASGGTVGVSVSADGSLKGWALPSGREQYVRIGTVRALAQRSDGKRVVAVRSSGLSILDTESGREVAFLEGQMPIPRGITVSANGKDAWIFDKDGELLHFSLPEESELVTWDGTTP